MKVWIMIKTNCDDCGGEMFLQVLSSKPTDNQMDEFVPNNPRCGMKSYVEVEIDGKSAEALPEPEEP